jgi:hypothetical protein
MKQVAEEINTSFKKERSEQLATPSSIARRRSKEIKSLQKSRSSQRSPSPEKVFDLQRSMEFEDSLDLIRANMNSMRYGATKSVGYRRRHPRPPLTQFIGMFESSKPAASAAGGLCAPLPLSRPSPPPMATALHSNQSLAPDQRALPAPSSPSHVDRPLSSSSESSSDGSSSGRTSPGEQSLSTKNPKQVRKTPLALRKSLPVVQRSKAQAHGERGDRNSHCDSAHSHLVESQALLRNSDKTGDSGTAKPSTTPEPVIKPEVKERPVPTIPRKPLPPLLVPSAPAKAKKPAVPPKQVLLPDKPAVLTRTTLKKPQPPSHTTRPRKAVLPPVKFPSKSLDNQEQFVIDMSSGQPVVSLPPVLQQSHPPSPPPATFFPSMLRPSKSSLGGGVGIRSSVLARQEQMIEEMIRSGAGSTQATNRTKQNTAAPPQPGNSVAETGRKVPLMPPPTKSTDQRGVAPTTQHKLNVALPTSA